VAQDGDRGPHRHAEVRDEQAHDDDHLGCGPCAEQVTEPGRQQRQRQQERAQRQPPDLAAQAALAVAVARQDRGRGTDEQRREPGERQQPDRGPDRLGCPRGGPSGNGPATLPVRRRVQRHAEAEGGQDDRPAEQQPAPPAGQHPAAREHGGEHRGRQEEPHPPAHVDHGGHVRTWPRMRRRLSGSPGVHRELRERHGRERGQQCAHHQIRSSPCQYQPEDDGDRGRQRDQGEHPRGGTVGAVGRAEDDEGRDPEGGDGGHRGATRPHADILRPVWHRRHACGHADRGRNPSDRRMYQHHAHDVNAPHRHRFALLDHGTRRRRRTLRW
jgi:hypothetical protein